MIKLKQFVFNSFSENTYVIWDDISLESVVIDPGCENESEELKLTEFISQNKLRIKFLINTHCHIDHILGCKLIKEKYNPVFMIPEEDLPLLQNADLQGKAFGISGINPPEPDKFIKDNEVVYLGTCELKLIFTPGHTPGEYCIYAEADNLLIAGDVLFQGSIGRTDLWGGDYEQLISSINTRLMTLPDEVVVYPGHGDPTTIGQERQYNPFLNE